MLQMVRQLGVVAVQARLLLLINHVLSREAAAQAHLRRHAGRRLRVELANVPAWLPSPPTLRVTITPAGLFDLDPVASEEPPDLNLGLSLPAPPQWPDILAGHATPDVRLQGSADLAGDIQWLADNLRWDIEADLARLVGPMPARLTMNVGRAGADALRRVVGRTSGPDVPQSDVRSP